MYRIYNHKVPQDKVPQDPVGRWSEYRVIMYKITKDLNLEVDSKEMT